MWTGMGSKEWIRRPYPGTVGEFLDFISGENHKKPDDIHPFRWVAMIRWARKRVELDDWIINKYHGGVE